VAWLLEQNVDRGICGSWYLQKGRGSTRFVVVWDVRGKIVKICSAG
jgi:hypothetical protein